MNFFSLLCVFLLYTSVVSCAKDDDNKTEQTTESSLADTVLPGDAIKTESQKVDEEPIKQYPGNAQPQTIADFIIHPLIAIKPRQPDNGNVKQAAGSSTAASPWQLFGFNGGQGISSSVSSLAGTVTGWLGNRIQLPGLVETPVRELFTTTSTTTTVRPEIIVKIQQRPNTRKPLNAISNKNEPPFRRYNRPNRFNVVNYADESEESDESSEYEDYANFAIKRKNRRRYQNYQEYDDDEQNASSERNENDENVEDHDPETEEEQIEEEEEEHQRPINSKRRLKPLTAQKRNNYYSLRSQLNQNQKHQQTSAQDESNVEDRYAVDDQNSHFSTNQESKRSQNEWNFIQRSQQNLLQQTKQFARGQKSPEEASSSNKPQKSNKPAQSAALLIKRNGQGVYVAPELLQISQISHNRDRQDSTNKPLTGPYSQAPLTIPLKRKNQPTQYITIPWNNLDILKPNQPVLQSEPLILTIPQDAMKKIHKLGNLKRNPNLTTNTVPLLAEAPTPIRYIVNTPRIVPARSSGKKPVTTFHIRPVNMVEKVPKETKVDSVDSAKSLENDDTSTPFIVIADEAFNQRKKSNNAYRQILDYFNQNRLRRQLNDQESFSSNPVLAEIKAQPVQNINAAQDNTETAFKATTESPIVVKIPQIESQSDEMN